MTGHADGDPLYAALVKLTNRRLSMRDVYEALGVSKPTYYRLRDEDKLLDAHRLIAAAQHLDINPVDLLVACRILAPGDAMRYVSNLAREYGDIHGFLEANPLAKGRDRQADDVSKLIDDIGSPSDNKRLQKRGKRA